MKKYVVLISCIAVMLGLVGCSGASSSGKVSIVGSTTVAVPVEKLANTYQQNNPGKIVEVQGVGSSAGIKAAHEKTAAIGMASRELKESEKQYGLKEIPIAYDGIAVAVHPSNGIKSLSMEEVKDIYEGRITHWSEVGGIDEAIIVITREAGSGTRSAFEEIVGLQEDRDGKTVSTIAQTALVAEGNGTVKATVASKENGIGFISLGTVDETIKPLAINGVDATTEAVLQGSYPISRRLLILTQPTIEKETQAFIDFVLSKEGQSIVSENYIPVN